jgi:hypothetical protein
LSAELDAHLDELTTRVIREAIDDDVSEASDETPKSLGNGVTNQGAGVGSVDPGSARFADEELGPCDVTQPSPITPQSRCISRGR